MLTLSQLRRRVNALRRKYARDLAVVRLRPLAEEFSQQWAVSLSQRRPAPQPQPFIRRIAQSGFRLNTFMALHKYLERCRRETTILDSLGIISSLLPQVPFDRLRDLLRWDTPAPATMPFPTLPWANPNLPDPAHQVRLPLNTLYPPVLKSPSAQDSKN